MLNNVILMGRLTKTPELKYTTGGKAYTSFSVAIERKPSKDGQQQTDFIPCTAWNKTAEFISKWFSKGRMILVEGSIESYRYEENGKSRTSYSVIVRNAEFTGEKQQAQQGGYPYQGGTQGYNSPAPQAQSSYKQQTIDDYGDGFTVLSDASEDDLPF